MRVRTIAGLTAVAGTLVFAAPAMAWDEGECADWYAKTGQIHPDCTWWTPPVVEKPPPVVPPVAPPVTPPAPPVAPPEAPPVVPPTVVPPNVPGTPPVAPKEEKPKKPRYTHPDRPREGTAGKQETRGSSTTASRVVSTSGEVYTENGALPYTGIPAGLLALAGVGLAAAGFRLRRR